VGVDRDSVGEEVGSLIKKAVDERDSHDRLQVLTPIHQIVDCISHEKAATNITRSIYGESPPLVTELILVALTSFSTGVIEKVETFKNVII
jgi:hypothetical protein